jgi:alpha-tubulin suppressor-like RCC1 family protein
MKDKRDNSEDIIRSKRDNSARNSISSVKLDVIKEKDSEKLKTSDSKERKRRSISQPIVNLEPDSPSKILNTNEKYDNKIFCWGFGKYGQIGTINYQYSADPLELIKPAEIEDKLENDMLKNQFFDIINEEINYIHCGEFHSSILTKNNNIYSYGKNTFGQLGLENDDIVCYPKLVSHFKMNKIVINSIALGGEHTLALSNKNELFSWGLNIFGQLGINSTVNSKIPVKIEKIRNFVRNEQTKVVEKEVIKRISENEKILEIAAGAQHSLILTSNNHLYSCGFSKNMSLGYFTKDEDPLESMIFTRIHAYSSTKKFSKITCGVNHSGCVFDNCEILFWGKGEYLSYENPTVINFNKYPITQITDFKIGENFYIIKNNNGELFSCGNNDYGQLGIGNNNNPKKHIEKVWINEKIRSFDCGYNFVIAISETNKVYGWGYNKTGQVLDLSAEKINLPKEITIFQEMGLLSYQVSCGGYHSILQAFLPKNELSAKIYEKIKNNIDIEKYKFNINRNFKPELLDKELSLLNNLDNKQKEIQCQIKEKEKEIINLNKKIEEKKQRMNLVPQRGKRKNEKLQADKSLQFDEEIKMEDLNFFKDSDIGTGTFGDVKKCLWRKTLVAVKFLKKAMENEKENIQSFVEELNLLKKLRHPNILLYLGANITGPTFFLVTEFCDLGNLFDFLHNNPRSELAEADRIRIALEIAKGVNYLHSFDTPILHRDLKSLNILLDKNMSVKIADFGWARLRDIHMTKQRGTFQWMAPEVIKKNSYSEKADIFSYGIILWELWVQEPPYKNIDRFEVAKSVATIKNYRPPLNEVIPESIKALISACWDYNPDNRPTFEMIIDFIERLIQAE